MQRVELPHIVGEAEFDGILTWVHRGCAGPRALMPDIQITVSPAVMGSSQRVGADRDDSVIVHSVVCEAAGLRLARS